MNTDAPWLSTMPELAGGAAERFGFVLRNLHLVGGDAISLARPGVTAIVGGNNVGKSTILRNIKQHLEKDQGQLIAGYDLIEKLDIEKAGSAGDLVAWISERAQYTAATYPGFAVGGNAIAAVSLAQAWDHLPDSLGNITPFVTYFAGARERLNFST